jgi:hypothetical protein
LLNNEAVGSVLFYLIVSLCCAIFLFFMPEHAILAQNQSLNSIAIGNQSKPSVLEPSLSDSTLRVEEVAKGFDFPKAWPFWEKMILYY